MEDKRLKEVIVAVQDYRIHGYSNTVFTDKGYLIVVEDYPGGKEFPRNLTNYRRITFEKVLGEKLDRNNFRTKLKKLKILERTNEKTEGVGKPTNYYKLNYKKLISLKGRSLF